MTTTKERAREIADGIGDQARQMLSEHGSLLHVAFLLCEGEMTGVVGLEHNNTEEKHAVYRKLDELAIHLAPKFLELDDLFSISGIAMMSIFLWRFPALLNGGLLSSLRDFSRKEVLHKREEGWKVSIYGRHLWFYLRVYDKATTT